MTRTEAQKKWASENRDKINEYMRRWRNKNNESTNIKQQEYRNTQNKIKINKVVEYFTKNGKHYKRVIQEGKTGKTETIEDDSDGWETD